MIIVPKKRKHILPVSQIKITSTPGGKIVIAGDGYINSRRVAAMTADKTGELYLFNNSQGYTVQHGKTTWSIPIHLKYLTADQYRALKPYIDKGPLKATTVLFKHKDGRREPVICIKRPVIRNITEDQITDLLQFLKSREG